MSKLEDIFPIADIKDGRMVTHEEVISIGFELSYPEVFLRGQEYYKDIHNQILFMIRQSPVHMTFHYLSMYDEEEYVPEYHTIENFLQRGKALHYTKRSIPLERHYLMISFGETRLPTSSQGTSLVKGVNILGDPYKGLEKKMEAIKLQIRNIEVAVKSVYRESTVKRLNDDELMLLLYRYYSTDYKYESPSDNAETSYQLPDVNFKDLTIGDERVGVVSLYEGRMSKSFAQVSATSPNMVRSGVKQAATFGQLNQSFVFPLTIGLPFKHAYSVIIQKQDAAKLLRNFEFEERVLNIPASLGLPIANNKIKHIQEFRELITTHDYSPVRLSMALIVPEKNPDLLTVKREAVKSSLSNISEMRGISELDEAGAIFLTNSPGYASMNYKSKLTTAAHAVSYLPKESHYKSDGKGFYFTDRFGKPVLIDVLNSPYMTNKNGVVIGPSGRGKSFALNYLLSLIYNEGHVVIIDKGGSYEKITQLLDGQYFDSAYEEQFAFAIFETIKDAKGDYVTDNIHISFILGVLVFIWKEGKSASPEEKNILSDIIVDYYEHINETKGRPTLTDFYHYVEKIAEDKTSTKSRFVDFDSFLLLLKPYALGIHKDLLNAEQQIDLTYERLIVFEMKALEKSNPTKFNLICLIITFLNIKKIQNLPRETFKSFIIDEALSFLKGDIGEFIGNLFAEVRKENGQVLVVAQGITYLLEASPEVQKKIFSNRDFIMMTNHDGYENNFPEYQKLLGFSDQDVELLKAVNRNEEIFLRLGNHGMILRVEVSEEEYVTFTTSPEEMKTIRELEKQYGSIHTALEQYALQRKAAKKKNV